MEAEEYTIGMGKYEVTGPGAVLVCVGIGSCIATVIFDSTNKIYGMAHVMLPLFNDRIKTVNPNKYANVCIPNMIKDMEMKGAKRGNMVAKIAGGAHMFPSLAKGDDANAINVKNIDAVHQTLREEAINIIGEDVGGNMGRTIKYSTDIEEFRIIIRSLNEEKLL